MNPRKRRPAFPGRLGPMPQIISRIRWRPGMSRGKLDKAITKELDAIWFSLLPQKEHQRKGAVGPGESNELSHRGRSILDEIILRQAETLGWRLLVSTRVLLRMSQWEEEESGPEFFEYLGRALAKSVRIVQKKELPPIDNPDLIPTQDQTVRELRIVRHAMRRVFSKSRLSLVDPKVLECFTRIVLKSGKSCPLLRANLARWQRFFEENPTSLRALALGKRASPADLFCEWLSWSKGHTPETLRKKISSLRGKLTSQ